jgi:hypothetical protein
MLIRIGPIFYDHLLDYFTIISTHAYVKPMPGQYSIRAPERLAADVTQILLCTCVDVRVPGQITLAGKPHRTP